MRILVTGAGGQLAHDLLHEFSDAELLAADRSRLDIGNGRQLAEVLSFFRPEVVVNTAAYNKVDAAEHEPDEAFIVNAAAVQKLARACADLDALLVHFSTDYVFDGSSARPYREEDEVNPLSVYGASKVAGEMAIRASGARHLIIRTTGLYGLGGRTSRRRNFVENMLTRAERGDPLRVVSDQVLTPTYCPDLALVARRLVESGETGTFHVTNSGECSWYEFAVAIMGVSGKQVEVLPIRQDEFQAEAKRPPYSVLGHERVLRAGLPELPSWEDALGAYLDRR